MYCNVWAKKILKGLIRLYQWTLSPFLGGQCRFHPTCSNYAMEVFETESMGRAGILIAKRLLKCHPFHPGGVDLAPQRTES